MKKFEKPEICIEELYVLDVITASTDECTLDTPACGYDLGL